MVEIITIGDELLIGQVVDTNSAWMGQQLTLAGFEVGRITSISDQRDEITEALGRALQRAEIVLMTGGLGPTRDDITKKTLSEYFNTRLVFNEDVFHDIQEFLKGRVNNINELNRDQALVPERSEVIRNSMGTAPIMWFNHKGRVVVSMPGIPAEMKTAMKKDIIPRLKEQFRPEHILNQTLLVYNIPEAVLAEKLTDWENKLPADVKLAYLPAPGRIRLRLTLRGADPSVLQSRLDKVIDDLQPLIGESIFGQEDRSVAELFADFFSIRHQTIALAESCSGGHLSHLITSIPGSSEYFSGGVVAYSNQMKQDLLGVSRDDIESYGAVSRQVVEQMAKGIQKQTGADYSIATSGVAGPGGGSEEKPVGTVWMAWANPEGQIISKVFRFGKERTRNVVRTSETALIELMQMMKKGEM